MPRMDQYDVKATPAPADLVLIIDVEDGSQSPDGTTKLATVGSFPGGSGGGAVSSVFGRTGAIVAQNGDYTAAQVGADSAGAAAAAQAAAEAASIPLAQKGAASGVATLDGSTRVPVAQIPQLADYAPTGLTGATAPTAYAGGTLIGHPLAGTWAVGQWVVDQTGHIYVCIAAGTPGTWRRVGADPDMFFLDDYCKGDVQVGLVNVTSAAPTVINTSPIPAPSAPTLGNAGTGGTILAGVYQAVITYVNRWGETVASTAASTTTTGSTSTITVTPPGVALSGNATGWKLYMTGPGGATFFLQGGVQALNVPVKLTAPPVTSGSQPPGSDSSAAQLFTSTAVDGGKDIMINGGSAAVPTAPMVGRIATVVSPTQATITVTNGNPITINASNVAMAFGSDDRLNVDQCISDATSYALLNNYLGRVIGGPKLYGVGQNFFQTTAGGANGGTPGTFTYNTQVRVPAPNPSGNTRKLDFQLLFPGDSAFSQFWMSQVPNTVCGFMSFGLGTQNPDPTYLDSSVVGGPQGGSGAGTNGFFNTKLTARGIQIWQPGWSNMISLDMRYLGGCRVHNGSSFAFAPSTQSGGNAGTNSYDQWTTNSFWKGHTSAGIRTPYQNDNEDSIVESYAVGGLDAGIRTQGEGLTISKFIAISADVAMVIDAPGGNPGHSFKVRDFHWEACNGAITVLGGSTANYLNVDIEMDSEVAGPLYDISDPANILHGTIRWNDTFRPYTQPILVGAQAVKIVNDAFGAALVPRVVPLTFGTTIPLQADLGNVFTLTLTASTGTLSNPTHPQDGQTIRVRVIQGTGGSFTLAYDTQYDFGSAGAPVLSTAAGKVDILGFEYVASASKWVYLGSALGG